MEKKKKARSLVYINLRNGKLKRKNCIVCGKRKTEAHHEDYSKPLKIMWLCKKHHVEKENRNKLKSPEIINRSRFKKCIYCNKTFICQLSLIGSRKYCNNKCYMDKPAKSTARD